MPRPGAASCPGSTSPGATPGTSLPRCPSSRRSSSEGRRGSSSRSSSGPTTPGPSAFVLDQPLFEAQAFIGVGAAARYKGLQEEVLRGRAQNLVTRVRLAYYGLLLAQEDLRLITESVDRVRQSLEETRGPEPGRHRLGLRRPPPGGGAGEPGARISAGRRTP